MNWLLDTDTCIDALRHRPSTLRRLRAMSPDDVAIASMTEAEPWYGAWRSRDPAGARQSVDSFLAPLVRLLGAAVNRKSRRGGARQFALCVNAGDYPASLQRRKLYELRPDPEAERLGQLRVVDDSGEDYLYPREFFQPVTLTPFLRRLLTSKVPKRSGHPRPSRRPTKVSTKQ